MPGLREPAPQGLNSRMSSDAVVQQGWRPCRIVLRLGLHRPGSRIQFHASLSWPMEAAAACKSGLWGDLPKTWGIGYQDRRLEVPDAEASTIAKFWIVPLSAYEYRQLSHRQNHNEGLLPASLCILVNQARVHGAAAIGAIQCYCTVNLTQRQSEPRRLRTSDQTRIGSGWQNGQHIAVCISAITSVQRQCMDDFPH
jgi:hypothetical protein